MRKVNELRSAEQQKSAAGEQQHAHSAHLVGSNASSSFGIEQQTAANVMIESGHQEAANNLHTFKHHQSLFEQQQQSPLAEQFQREQQQLAAARQQQQQQQSAIENYLMRQRQQAALEQQFNCLRTVSSCSNESTSSTTSSSGRYSSLAAHQHAHHFLLEPNGLDHLMDCSTNSSSRLATSPVCGASASATAHAARTAHASSPSPSQLFAHLSRQLRLLESPSGDSGVESGKENGSHSALGFSSSLSGHSTAGLSPVGGQAAALTHHHDMLSPAYGGSHRLPQMRTASALGQHQQWLGDRQHEAELLARQRNLIGMASIQQQQQNDTNKRRQQVRPASAMGQFGGDPAPKARASNAAEPAQQQQSSGSIDDMPMLKRALQAPPLINTNMLMDEAYRHHKKFRASQRAATSCGTHAAVNSTSGSRGSVSTKCSSSAASSALHSPVSCSPAPGCAGGQGRASPSVSRSGHSSSLADMHSTLLSKLAQPTHANEQQLKCNDLINEIILEAERDETSTTTAALSDVGDSDEPEAELGAGMHCAGAVAPASSPASTSSVATVSVSAGAQQHHHQQQLQHQPVDQLHKILLSGPQKQQQARQLQQQQRLLAGHQLVDEDYITRRLLGAGSQLTRRQQQPALKGHKKQHQSDGMKVCAAGRPNHHRPSSSCGSSSSPSPTSSLSSTLSPSPSSSMSPDLGMISESQMAAYAAAHHQQRQHNNQERDEQMQQKQRLSETGGNFGLLADVALAELEQRQQQQQLAAAAAAAAVAVAQPIDLSKK